MATTRALRELGLFLLGGAAFIHEVFLTAGDRPYVIFGSLALLGLPFVLRGENKLREIAKVIADSEEK